MSHFHTLKLSDPRFESQGLRHITVKSPALNARGNISFYLPTYLEAKQHLPIVILLHGVYGSHWSWAFNGGAHLTLQQLIDRGRVKPMVLVMPSDGLWGDGSGYMKHDWANYEKWIVEDVLHAIWESCPQTSRDSPQFIGGLSMGGYGALRLGAKYGRQFKGISAHSAITKLHYLKAFVQEDWGEFTFPEADSSVLEACLTYKDTLPPIRFDCGVEDDLINANRTLHKRLERAGIAHIYEEFKGGHTWPYWEEHLAKSLLFFSQQL